MLTLAVFKKCIAMCNWKSEHLQNSTPGALDFSSVMTAGRRGLSGSGERQPPATIKSAVSAQLLNVWEWCRQLVLNHLDQTKAHHLTASSSVLFAGYTVREKNQCFVVRLCDRVVCFYATKCYIHITVVIKRQHFKTALSHIIWQADM